MSQTNGDPHHSAVVDRWPLVGRGELLERLPLLLKDPDGPHVAIFGDAGFGKTALARAVLAATAGDVYAVGLNALPDGAVAYGALSNLLVDMPAVEAQGALAVARAVAAHLEVSRAGAPCVVWVDDVHEVDEASADVLSRLARARKIRLVLTSRPGSQLPQPLAALLRSEAIERVDVGPLHEHEVAELLQAVLGAPPTLGATRQILRASDGNPLYIRELVRDALRQGSLVQHDGLWAWRGPDAEAGLHLREMVASQLAARPAAHREALELVALAEPVSVTVLLELASSADIDALERERLIVVEGHSPPTVRLAHPIYGEAVRALVPTGRRVELRRRMVAALENATDDSLLALMRSVGWALDCGIDVEPERLVRAAEHANRSHDYVFAARASRAAIATRVDHRARMALAFAYRFTGRVADALVVLEGSATVDPDERVDLLLARAVMLQYELDRVSDAMSCLEEAVAIAPDPQRERAIVARRFVHGVYGGRGNEHLADGERLFAAADTPFEIRYEIAPSLALMWTFAGRSDTAVDMLRQLIDRVPPAADRNAWSAEEVVYMSVAISLIRGTMPMAGEAAGHELAAADPTVRFDPGIEQLGIGWFELNGGRMRSAGSQLNAAISSLMANDPSGFQGLALALAAEAAAVAGERGRALQLAAECRNIGLRTSRMLTGQLERALLWPGALASGFERSIAEAHLIAERLLAQDEVSTAAHVLHDAIRLGDQSVASRVAELAAKCDGPRLHACGLHATGLATANGSLLADAAEAFAAAGLNLHAAEAWSDAADAHRAAGRRDSARRAAAAATLLVSDIGTVSTPRLMRNVGTQPLTRREVEIASLAARNLSNAEIAEVLGLGRRTVEGHLHRAYGKLGVSNRDELALILR